jgi:hypothetical protein
VILVVQDPEYVAKFLEVFLPYAARRTERVEKANGRFVYYTSAATACSILEKEEVWLRNARLMNDYSEVSYGWQCLLAAWNDPEVQAVMNPIFDQIGPDLKERIETKFTERLQERVFETYIICVSEHGSELKDDHGQLVADEDLHGRLSMWRAYAGDSSVAFVFKNAPFFNDSNAFPAFTSPVMYADTAKFKSEFLNFIKNLEDNIEWLKEQGPVCFVQSMETALVAAILSTKHPAFAEEREWRVIYSPTVMRSDNIKMEVMAVGGIPQRIQKLPLKDIPEAGLVGITIPDFLDRIIIGPTQEPNPIAAALGSLLSNLNVTNPYDRIRISNVPLRK